MRFKNIFFAAAAAMALTACSSDDAIETVQQQSQFPEDGVMRFTTNLVDPTAVTTRASITGSDVNQNGQQFQVKIVNFMSAQYSYFNTVQFDGTSFMTTALAPICTLSPIVIPPQTTAPVPINTLLPMVGCFMSTFLPIVTNCLTLKLDPIDTAPIRVQNG